MVQDQLKAAVEAGDLAGYLQANVDWHLAVVHASHNELLIAFMTAIAEAAKAAGKEVGREPAPPAKPGTAKNQAPGYLYEAHIRPFVGYGIRGVLWDQGESGTAVGGVAGKAVSAEQMEITRLKAELARMRMERDILKKAAAYFARESR